MNICYIINHPGSGGSEKYLEYLAKEAKKSGNKVYFIFGEDGSLIKKVAEYIESHEIIRMSSWWSLRSVIKIKKYIKDKEIDVIHSNFLREHTQSVMARIFGAKVGVVRTIHRADKFSKGVYLFMKVLNIFTDKIIVPAKFLEKEMNGNGIKNTTNIANGVEVINVENHKNNLGYIGRIHAEKGITELSRYIKGNQFILAGDGPDEDKIKNKNIKMIGRVEKQSEFFSKISVLVNPSSTEVLPLSYLEAFSCGVPVVCFDIPANKEIINEKLGMIVKNGDYKGLIEAASEILLNSKKLEELSNNVKKEFKNKYTAEMMWQKTESVYKSLI